MFDISRIDTAAQLLTDVTLKATVLLVAACMAACVSRRSSAAFKHRLWSLTLFGVLLLPLLSWALPAWQLAVLPLETQPAPLSVPSAVSAPLEMPEPRHYDVAGAPMTENEPQPLNINAAEPAHSAVAASSFEPTPSQWLVGGWMLGGLVSLAFLARGWWRARAMIRRSHVVADEQWQQLLTSLQRRLPLRRRIELREGADAVVPLTWGIVRPVVLIPSTSAAWSEELKQSVLLHELLHIQRGDIAFQLVGRLACVAYWFHPLAWFALHRLRHDREQACDDAVVHTGEKASDYAGHLLEIARHYHYPQGISLAIEMARPGKLEQRLQAMFDERRSHRPMRRSLAVMLLMLIVGATTGVAVFEPVGETVFAVASDEAPASEEGREKLPGGADVRLGGMEHRLYGHSQGLTFLDDDLNFIYLAEKTIDVVDGKTGIVRRSMQPDGFYPSDIQVTQDRETVVIRGTRFPPNTAGGVDYRLTKAVFEARNITTGKILWTTVFDGSDLAPGDPFVLSPDGHRLIVHQNLGDVQRSDYICIYEAKSGKLIHRLPAVGAFPAQDMAISPNEAVLAMGGYNWLYLWELPLENHKPRLVRKGYSVIDVAFSPDSQWLAAGTDVSHPEMLVDATNGKIAAELKTEGPGSYVPNVTFSNDSKTLYGADATHATLRSAVGGVTMWNVATGKLQDVYREDHFAPSSVAVSPSGEYLAFATSSAAIQIRNLDTGEVIASGPEGHRDFITGFAFVPYTSQMVTGSLDETERTWDVQTGKQLLEKERPAGLTGLAVSHDGALAASSGYDDEIQIWEPATGKVQHRLKGHGVVGGAVDLAFSKDNSMLTSFGYEGSSPIVKQWDAATGNIIREYALSHEDPLESPHSDDEFRFDHWQYEFGRFGANLYVASSKTLVVYDTTTGMERHRYDLPAYPRQIAASPDGKYLAIDVPVPAKGDMPANKNGGERVPLNREVVVINAVSGEIVWRQEQPSWKSGSIAFSSKGDVIAVGSRGEVNQLRILSADDGKFLFAIDGIDQVHGGHWNLLSFSHDDRWLASTQRDHTILIWDFEKLRREKVAK